jgi:tRNA(Ile)-lysidine synthase
MKQVIDRFILKHDLVKPDDRMILAVSGGPDSMAMLRFFQDMQVNFPTLQLTVAHVEHGLRGKESKEDAEFVRGYCQSHGIPFHLHEPDVRERKQQEGLSTQEAARICRYEWFEELMNKIKADKLVLAHHGDDQIETMMMRQIRGSLPGRKGIPVKRPFANGLIIRPFLCVEKTDLVNFCQVLDVPYRIDASNEGDDYQRNRIRHHILPHIKRENHKAHEIFQWQSEAWTEDEDWLLTEAEAALDKVIQKKDTHRLIIDVEKFRPIHLALQRRVIHLILSYLCGNNLLRLDRHHIESVQNLLSNEHPSLTLHLPDGLTVEKSYESLDFSNRFINPRIDYIDTQILEIPSEVNLPLGKLVISRCSQLEEACQMSPIKIDLDKVVLPLLVRSRKNGDRMSFVGGKGTKKLKDLFIDQKIPKRDRDVWPIVIDSHDTILSVPFLKRSNEALVDRDSTNVAHLTYDFYT